MTEKLLIGLQEDIEDADILIEQLAHALLLWAEQCNHMPSYVRKPFDDACGWLGIPGGERNLIGLQRRQIQRRRRTQ